MEEFSEESDPIEQVVQKVVCFSSQYGADQSQSYAAWNLAGESYNFPSYGDFTQAFVLRSYGPWWDLAPSGRAPVNNTSRKNNFISEDFVDIQFQSSVFPTKIEIFETYNPGAVVRILALLTDQETDKQRWITLWAGQPQQCPPRARKFSPPLRKTDHPTNLIRLEFNQQHLSYYTELDAVYLYGTLTHRWNSIEDPESLERIINEVVSLTAHSFSQLSLTKGQENLKRNGFFDILPSELIHFIFSFLGLIDLIRAARTCRLFFLHCYDPVWFKELDLKPYWSLITSDALDSLHTRCSSTEKLDLSWSGPYDAVSSQTISRFLQHCGSNLVCLRLSCCQFVDNQVIRSVCQQCPNLEELDLQSCNSKSLTRDGLLRIQDLKKLKRINLYRVQVTDDVMEGLTHSLRNLQHLNLGGCHTLEESDLLMRSLRMNCKGLVSLDLWRNKGLTSDGVVCLADGCVLLEELDIGWCMNVTSTRNCVVYLASKCKKLKKLFLTALRSVNDDVINALADNCPDIEQVDVLGTGQIHADSINRLLRQCKKLRFLDISFCSQLTIELVRDLQAMYPSVAIKKSFIVDESA